MTARRALSTSAFLGTDSCRGTRRALAVLDGDHVADLAGLGANLVERAVGDDAARGDDNCASTGGLDLVQVVRGQEDGALLANLLQVFEKLRFLVRIEIARGLVEDEDRRVVNEGLREPDSLPVAVREVADLFSQYLGQAADLDDALRALLEGVLVELSQVAREAEVLEHAHLEVERRALRQVAEALTDLQRLVEDVVAVDARRAPGRGDEAREDAHRGRLAGAVGAQEADDFATTNLEVDLVDRTERAEALAQLVRVDHHVGGHPTSENCEWGVSRERARIAGKCGEMRPAGLPRGRILATTRAVSTWGAAGGEERTL